MLGFSADLTAGFDHDHPLQPRPVMAFLKPIDVIYHGCSAGFDTAVIAIDSGVAGDLCVGKIPSLLFRGEKLDVLAQRSLITFQSQHIIGFLIEDRIGDIALAPNGMESLIV